MSPRGILCASFLWGHECMGMPTPFCRLLSAVSDQDRVLLQSVMFASREGTHTSRDKLAELAVGSSLPAEASAFVPLPKFALRAGPRSTIYHTPEHARVALVTCGE